MKDRRRKHRLYLPQLAALDAHEGGVELALAAAESHHALHVLRLRAGDAVEVFDGHGRRAEATICRAGKSDSAVRVGPVVEASARQGPAVHLAVALPKGERMDWLLEKATEVGAESIIPVVFERSLAGREELSEAKRGRWLGHCVSAAKQSGLDFLPELREPMTLGDFLAKAPEGLALVGDPSAAAGALREALATPAAQVTIIVGPEGGLSAAEEAIVGRCGFRPVRLGTTTLRIETAAIALLAAVVAMAE